MPPKKKATGKQEEPVAAPKAADAAPKAAAAAEGADAAEKRPAAEAPPGEPGSKAARVEGTAVAGAAGAELEADAPPDARPGIDRPVVFQPSDSTLNVVPALGGRVLMSLAEGGMQYLIAGARADLGLRAGRYVFGVRILEALAPGDPPSTQSRAPKPRQLLRIGFSAAGSPLVLGEGEDHVCFDAEGFFYSGKRKSMSAPRLRRDEAVAVVLNLDPASPNAYTVSLFRDGARASSPQPLPEHLRGCTLFPHVSFRSITLQVHIGPELEQPLPFACRPVGAAARADTEAAALPAPAADGKFEVLMPVGYPNEGTFDWLDEFLRRTPGYVELSDRKILEWAAHSGLTRLKGALSSKLSSRDKPDFGFGLPGMDDFSVRRVLLAVAPLVPRNYIIMEVRANLIEEERREIVQLFSGASYRRTARVIMGEPDDEYKAFRLDRILEQKQAKSEIAWKAKQDAKKRQRAIQRSQQQATALRKKKEEARNKAREEATKKLAEAVKSADSTKKEVKKEEPTDGADGGAAGPAAAGPASSEPAAAEGAPKAEETKQEALKEEVKEEEKKEVKEEEKEEKEEKDEAMGDSDDESPPQVELTEEESKQWFAAIDGVEDLTAAALGQSFVRFSLPHKEEGFDEIVYEWDGPEASAEYLREKVIEKKRTTRIEELQPGKWFKEKHKQWTKVFAEWQAKQKAWKNTDAAKAEAAKGLDEEQVLNDEEIWTTTDICDMGDGKPLFKDFEIEDWGLLQLRFELWSLQAGFRRDVDDPDRPGFPEAHLGFYLSKYHRKQIVPKNFGLGTIAEVLDLVQDLVTFEGGLFAPTDPESEDIMDFPQILRMTELQRRERGRRIDAGDESARLRFTQAAVQPSPGPAPPAPQPKQPKQPGATQGSAVKATPASSWPAWQPAPWPWKGWGGW